MDDAEKMLLNDIKNDIQTLNKYTLYLCRHSSCSENRLKNIEDAMITYNKELDICKNKVNTMRSWGIAIGTIIVLMIPAISAMM